MEQQQAAAVAEAAARGGDTTAAAAAVVQQSSNHSMLGVHASAQVTYCILTYLLTTYYFCVLPLPTIRPSSTLARSPANTT